VFAELLQIRFFLSNHTLLFHDDHAKEEKLKSQIKSLDNVMKKYGSLSSTQVILAWLQVSKLKLNKNQNPCPHHNVRLLLVVRM
jgi:hypothetical protein